MIEAFTKAWFANLHTMREKFEAKHPENYLEVVKAVVQMLHDANARVNDILPDPNAIHEIDDGDYQGTLVYVIAADGYQPSEYFYVRVAYGSCSGCDTLQAINCYSDNPPDADQVRDYMTLALHVVQKLRLMDGEAV